jgi:hypothetical protein
MANNPVHDLNDFVRRLSDRTMSLASRSSDHEVSFNFSSGGFEASPQVGGEGQLCDAFWLESFQRPSFSDRTV